MGFNSGFKGLIPNVRSKQFLNLIACDFETDANNLCLFEGDVQFSPLHKQLSPSGDENVNSVKIQIKIMYYKPPQSLRTNKFSFQILFFCFSLEENQVTNVLLLHIE